jgi:uncharacterized protein YdcH (DUF465 family)
MTDVTDGELTKRLFEEDSEFRRLMEEHKELEERLEIFNQKPFLTPEEEVERKKIQKLKLLGKDQMEAILSKHRT